MAMESSVSPTLFSLRDASRRNRPVRTVSMLSLLLLLISSSCMQSDYEKLQGRWYNSSMSVRFRKDGSVFLNTSTGPAFGRYAYQPTSFNSSTPDRKVPNLTLDVVRNDVLQRMEFEVVMMSRNRIRMTYLGSPTSGDRPRSAAPQILRREDPSNPPANSTTVSTTVARAQQAR